MTLRGAAFATACALAGAWGCTPHDSFSLRFPRSTVRQVVREVRVFVFAAEVDGGDPPRCATFDPRGAAFGDAEIRTGRRARIKLVAPLDDEIGELPDVPVGPHTFVFEAWSPRCADIGTNVDDTTFCRRTEAGDATVLRGYACRTIELSARRRSDVAVDLQPFANIGAAFQTPESRDIDNPVVRYDETGPQPVVEGVPSRFPFRVQLIDELGNDLDGVPVHWSVSDGFADLEGPAVVVTGEDPILLGQGISQAYLRAGAGAADVNDGRIVVSAYAPGFENAPFRFYARAVPGVQTRVRQVDLPRDLVTLEDVDVVASPVEYEDLDDDGRPDVLTVTGIESHRLVALYERDDGAFDVRVSETASGMPRALTVARTGPGAPTVIVSSARRLSSTQRETPDGLTWIVEDPAIELWTTFQRVSPDPVTPGGPIRLTALDGTPLSKVAISMDAADIDDDGYDELVASRCSYLVRGEPSAASQNRRVLCYGASVTDSSDGELAVLSAVTDGVGAVVDYRERAIVEYFGLPGGFRSARFADVNGDGSLDVVTNNAVQVLGRCGAKEQASEGFGYRRPENGFFVDTGFSQNFGLAAGRLNDDPFADIVSTGALRLNSADAGFAVVLGGSCGTPARLPAIVSGPRTSAHMLSVEMADLNGDGWDDVLLLHRALRRLQLFFGVGTDDVAAGPVIDLPAGPVAEFGVASVGTTDRPVTKAAIPLRRENAILFVEIEPDR